MGLALDAFCLSTQMEEKRVTKEKDFKLWKEPGLESQYNEQYNELIEHQGGIDSKLAMRPALKIINHGQQLATAAYIHKSKTYIQTQPLVNL